MTIDEGRLTSCLRAPAVCIFLIGVLLLVGCGERVIIEDKFDGNSPIQWLLESDELGQSGIQNGELVFLIPAAGVARYATAQGIIAGNFIAEVEVIQRGGSTNSGYGMLIRMQDNQQFYRFDVTGNGYYMVEKRTAGGGVERLSQDWQQTSLLLTGTDVRNLLKVEARGSTLTFFINGFEVFEISDPAFSSGGIALDAGTFDQGGLIVAFDNFSLETR